MRSAPKFKLPWQSFQAARFSFCQEMEDMNFSGSLLFSLRRGASLECASCGLCGLYLVDLIKSNSWAHRRGRRCARVCVQGRELSRAKNYPPWLPPKWPSLFGFRGLHLMCGTPWKIERRSKWGRYFLCNMLCWLNFKALRASIFAFQMKVYLSGPGTLNPRASFAPRITPLNFMRREIIFIKFYGPLLRLAP